MRKLPRGRRTACASAVPHRDERGTSLVELLVVATLLVLVLGTVVPLLEIGRQSWSRVDRHLDMLQNGRRGVDKLVRDLRAAQSFTTITPTLLRFAHALGDGSGAVRTVEYQLNAGSGELQYRVAADFSYRRRITINAGANAIPIGYSVSVTFDHAALVTAGKSLANGDDVRVRYWNGTKWIDLDRVKDVPTNWNTTTTRLWFAAQTAIPAGGSNNNYYVHYGDLSAATPPANGDYVFLDYEDGSTLAGWTRRDACSGAYATSADGFLFTATTTSCYRELTKALTHTNVEIFWGFRSDSPATSNNRHQVGVGARRSDVGLGYVATPAEATNGRLRVKYVTSWSAAGTTLAQTATGFTITPGADYYGRFMLVGTTLSAKYWAVGAAEPAWMITATHSGAASGPNYGLVDGLAVTQTHRHRTVIIRQRVDPDPTTTLGVEESGARPDVFESLAGPFRSMAVLCYNAAGIAIACAPASAVRSVEVALTAMDSTGEVADIVLSSRAYRQAP